MQATMLYLVAALFDDNLLELLSIFKTTPNADGWFGDKIRRVFMLLLGMHGKALIVCCRI